MSGHGVGRPGGTGRGAGVPPSGGSVASSSSASGRGKGGRSMTRPEGLQWSKLPEGGPSGSDVQLMPPGAQTSTSRLRPPTGTAPWPQTTAARPGADQAIVDIPERMRPPPPTALERSRAALNGALANLPFADELTTPHAPDEQGRPHPLEARRQELLHEQQALENEYVLEKGSVLAARQALFGDTFAIGNDQVAPWRGSVATVLIEALKGATAAAVRTPVTNTIATALDPAKGEFSTAYDAVTLGGPVGGLAAYAADTFNLSVERRAKAHNLAQLVPVDVKVLVPAPSRVAVTLTAREGRAPTKSFHRLSNAELAAATLAVTNRRKALGVAQVSLSGQGPLVNFLQGGISGALNTFRRVRMTAEQLASPIHVGVYSALAGGTAGFIVKGANNVAKVMPGLSQVKVDDLVGGEQVMNLFALKHPHADRAPASLRTLPRIYGEALTHEWLALMFHTVDLRRGPHALLAQGVDLARYVVGATFTAVFASATGPFTAQIYRDGKLDRLPGESLSSRASQLQQFGQSGVNDAIWNALKTSLFAGMTNDVGASYDQQQDAKRAWLRDSIAAPRAFALTTLRALEDLLATAAAEVTGDLNAAITMLTPERPEAPAVRTALDLMERMRMRSHLRGALDTAAQYLDPVISNVLRVRNAIVQLDQMDHWRVSAPRLDAPRGA